MLLAVASTASLGQQRTNTLSLANARNLSLPSLADFWQDGSPEISERDPSGVLFSHSSGFLGSLVWRTKERNIGISVFVTQEAAVAAMECRTTNVASVITQGTNVVLAAKWWYISGIPNGIFVCHRNAIVEVGCYGGKYADRAELLKSTVRQVIQNIEDSITAKKEE